MSNRIPKPGTVLLSDDGCALVVPHQDYNVLDALIEIVEDQHGGDVTLTNPYLTKLAAETKVQVWYSCSKAWQEAESVGDDYTDYASDWWAPYGDGKRSVYVVSVDVSGYTLGELAEEAEPDKEPKESDE